MATNSPTLTQVIDLVRFLASDDQGKCTLADKEICRLLYFENLKHKAGIPVGLLAMLAAARYLETVAQQLARTGNVKTLTFSFSGATSANALLSIARGWRDEVAACLNEAKPKAGFVKLGRACRVDFDRVYKCCQAKDAPQCKRVSNVSSNTLDFSCCMNDECTH